MLDHAESFVQLHASASKAHALVCIHGYCLRSFSFVLSSSILTSDTTDEDPYKIQVWKLNMSCPGSCQAEAEREGGGHFDRLVGFNELDICYAKGGCLFIKSTLPLVLHCGFMGSYGPVAVQLEITGQQTARRRQLKMKEDQKAETRRFCCF